MNFSLWLCCRYNNTSQTSEFPSQGQSDTCVCTCCIYAKHSSVVEPCCEASLWEPKGRGSTVSVRLQTQTRRCARRHPIPAALILRHSVYCLESGVQIKGGRKKKKKTQTSSDLRQWSPFPRSSNDRLRLPAESKMFQSQLDPSVQKTQSKLSSPCFDPQVTDDSSTFGKPEVNLWQAPVNRNKSQVRANFFSFVGNWPQFLGTFHLTSKWGTFFF